MNLERSGRFPNRFLVYYAMPTWPARYSYRFNCAHLGEEEGAITLTSRHLPTRSNGTTSPPDRTASSSTEFPIPSCREVFRIISSEFPLPCLGNS